MKRTQGDLGPVPGSLVSELVLLWKVTGSQDRFWRGQGMVGVLRRRETWPASRTPQTQLFLLTLLEHAARLCPCVAPAASWATVKPV